MEVLPKILAIETSCDETAAAVAQGNTIISQETYSQLAAHAEFGGVVPSIAKLEHQRKIEPVINTTLNRAGLGLEDMDAVAVTVGPGLAIALEVGLQKAKDLSTQIQKPLIAVNHMHGHLFSPFAGKDFAEAQYPALGILVSGKHTELVLVESTTKLTVLAETLDDACGEAFDKFARLMGLPYPGGPEVSKKAKEVEQEIELKIMQENGTTFCITTNTLTGKQYKLPIPLARNESPNVSYSGLKTAIKNIVTTELGVTTHQNIQDIAQYVIENPLDAEVVKHLCFLFQATAFLQIRFSIEKVLKIHPELKEFWMGGGVVANEYFRNMMAELASKHSLVLRVPERELSTDNGAMIGIAASLQWQAWQTAGGQKETSPDYGIYFAESDKMVIERIPGLPI